ncbi:MAG TPA: hypothetical protein VFD38_19885, partial [Myxococcaceae bacterium]|nr:hypothetical protein [Myxococcaceae bacterium]
MSNTFETPAEVSNTFETPAEVSNTFDAPAEVSNTFDAFDACTAASSRLALTPRASGPGRGRTGPGPPRGPRPRAAP